MNQVYEFLKNTLPSREFQGFLVSVYSPNTGLYAIAHHCTVTGSIVTTPWWDNPDDCWQEFHNSEVFPPHFFDDIEIDRVLVLPHRPFRNGDEVVTSRGDNGTITEVDNEDFGIEFDNSSRLMEYYCTETVAPIFNPSLKGQTRDLEIDGKKCRVKILEVME